MMNKLPTSAQAYRELLQEETHLGLSNTKPNETLACKVDKRTFQPKKGNKNNENYSKKQQLYYEHCKISGHTKDKC